MKNAKTILLVLLICAAVVSAAYAMTPLVFRARMTKRCEEDAEQFYTFVSELQESEIVKPEQEARPYPELYAAMREYNDTICRNGQNALVSRASYQMQIFDLTQYSLPDQTFGVIRIPKMDLEMPLFLGASEENMAAGAAVLSQTSIPIGGENTNAVIAGHRGWNGYPYFKEIELLEKGDEITVTNIWETLTYEVTEIKIIPPNDVDAILIQKDRDMITLLTCHPYASGGKYRYLVFCERTEADTE